MDRDPVMDPAASPARPGVRRVNNLPVAILGAAFAVFLAIMAYVTAGRAALREDREDPEVVRSALALAKSIAGDDEAGMVPAAPATAKASAGPAAEAAAAESSQPRDSLALPVFTGGQGDFPGPPLPPRLLDGGSETELLPPASAQGTARGVMSERDATTPYSSALGADEDARDLHRMKWEMFKQAVRAKTATMADTADETASSRPADRLAQARAKLAAAQAHTDGDPYVEKLRRLQQAGFPKTGTAMRRRRALHTATRTHNLPDARTRIAGR